MINLYFERDESVDIIKKEIDNALIGYDKINKKENVEIIGSMSNDRLLFQIDDTNFIKKK